MKFKRIIVFCFLLLLTACGVFRSRIVVYNVYDKIPMNKNLNVCKSLNDTVVVYAVFVDVGMYHPWTEFDIESTIDSLEKATNWIEKQGNSFSKNVVIENEIHKEAGRLCFHEKETYPRVALSSNDFRSNTVKSCRKVTPWSDQIAKRVGKKLNYIPSNKIKTKIKVTSTQNLNLALRDKFNRENVAIIYFVNGYYENHPSFSFNTESSTNVEFSIITSKNTAVIAHEILHLFGAVDLYPNNNYPNFNYVELAEKYPSEIMKIQHKSIEKLSVSPITAYFIGWRDSLSYSDNRLLLHKEKLVDY